ncbi:hypothetical protein FJW06_20730 [Mesorhizobium sp. B4-1-3]|uniref:hypothetical protein n=1 Tax=Mesorhizobium sp. B4-1-3 TaxID=2589889 RepID=UPI00112C0614|nr:hypothetical protein [Mesorhizobium sp. B4-1-3]TPI11152.1 hypothetical protein FJW06_20730 [Mesorhizobium sp. B4-1-3]
MADIKIARDLWVARFPSRIDPAAEINRGDFRRPPLRLPSEASDRYPVTLFSLPIGTFQPST